MKDFLSTDITFAVVVRADIDTIKDLKKYLDSYPDLQLVYQRIDLKKLYITNIAPSSSTEGSNGSE